MTMYYCPIARGFFDSRVHGARTIETDDPEWVRPTIAVTVPPHGEIVVGDEVLPNDTARAVKKTVPDPAARAPKIAVVNPDCKIPETAVEIADDEYERLLNGRLEGKLIVADAQGRPKLIDPPAPPVEELARRARERRDVLLTECDWTQLPDVPETTRIRWAEYRQALRDLTDLPGFPTEIVWPVAPHDE